MKQTPTVGQLLNVWEQGRSQTMVQRAFSLLTLAVPAASADDLTRFSIGRRDQELLNLRELIFGSRMAGTARCPGCGQEVELEFSAADIRTPIAPAPDEIHAIQLDEYEVHFRLPTCEDIARLTPNSDPIGQKLALLQQCVTEAHLNGESVAAGMLPEAVTSALSSHMAELDPQGDIQLALNCPDCNRIWQSPLDIVSYFWSEIHSWAGRMLRDVHVLAAAYGWRETDILEMSPWRRQAYLEMIRQ